jgi:hypothetical protein
VRQIFWIYTLDENQISFLYAGFCFYQIRRKEGTVIMQMKGGEKVTLHPGDTFYEGPEGIHLVGKNASDAKPAKFLVFLVKDKGAPILVPVTK